MPLVNVRAFLALELDDAMRRKLASLVESLGPRLPSIAWVRPEGMHLTLRFLGSSPAAALAAMQPSLLDAAARCKAPSPRLSGLGLFPERGPARVLWIGLDLPESVIALQAECERLAVAVGFLREPRPFLPHLTLGRWRQPAARPQLPEADLGPAALHALVLYRSDPAPGGARYTEMARFPLAEAA
jgi:2'-5' RNA ligase